MKELVLYIHGKDGCAGESEHYKHRGKPGRKSGRRSQR